MNNAGAGVLVVLCFLLVLFVVLAGPFITIWILNTLFGLSLAYNLKNLIAAFFLVMFFGRSNISANSKK